MRSEWRSCPVDDDHVPRRATGEITDAEAAVLVAHNNAVAMFPEHMFGDV